MKRRLNSAKRCGEINWMRGDDRRGTVGLILGLTIRIPVGRWEEFGKEQGCSPERESVGKPRENGGDGEFGKSESG